MDVAHAALALQALGHEKRLEVFRTLVKAGHDGLLIGEIQSYLNIPASTLSHHLSMLVEAGLVHQVKSGRKVQCVAVYDQMTTVFEFVTQQCCAGIVLHAAKEG